MTLGGRPVLAGLGAVLAISLAATTAANAADQRPPSPERGLGIEYVNLDLRFETDKKFIASSTFTVDWSGSTKTFTYYLNNYDVRDLYIRFPYLSGIYVAKSRRPPPDCSLQLDLREREVGHLRVFAFNWDDFKRTGPYRRELTWSSSGSYRNGPRIRLPEAVLTGGQFEGRLTLQCLHPAQSPQVWTSRLLIDVRQ